MIHTDESTGNQYYSQLLCEDIHQYLSKKFKFQNYYDFIPKTKQKISKFKTTQHNKMTRASEKKTIRGKRHP